MKKLILILILIIAVVLGIVLYNQSKQQNQEEQKKEYVKMNIENYVRASANDYAVDPLGGISNLHITLRNISDYQVDDVTVEVYYYKVNDELYKTEMLQFHNLTPQGSIDLKAPDSDRGVKVRTKITHIRADVLGI
jgi:hypothetical protein